MPEPYDREGLIDRATDAINGGDPTRALEIAEEIRKGEGPSADEALIRGIALSSLGRGAEASDAFAEATRRAPNSHKARFNAAVHEFNAGNLVGARQLAEEALALEPTHGSTRELVGKIDEAQKPPVLEDLSVREETGAAAPRPGSSATYARLDPSTAAYPRPDDEEALPWIGRLGPRWLHIGLAIVGVNLLTFILLAIFALRASGESPARTMGEAIEAGTRAAQGLQTLPAYQVLSLLDFFAHVAAILWTIFDLVRRKGNFLWLVLVVPLSCLSLAWAVLPAYIALGRKS
ncbi:hypothetical protein EON77_20855 [bacterium]|nr:MAG: hypothetical protein EON77_20855 [bacterium]